MDKDIQKLIDRYKDNYYDACTEIGITENEIANDAFIERMDEVSNYSLISNVVRRFADKDKIEKEIRYGSINYYLKMFIFTPEELGKLIEDAVNERIHKK